MILGIHESRCRLPVCQAFLTGTGEKYKMIDVDEVKEEMLSDYEIIVFQGWKPRHFTLVNKCKEMEKEFYCLSDGFFKRHPYHDPPYFCVAKNGIHAYGEYLPTKGLERWQQIGIPLKRWSDGEEIIIAYQYSPDAYGKNRDPAFHSMVRSAVATGRKVKITLHPAGINKKRNFLNTLKSMGAEVHKEPSFYHYDNAHCLMTYDSNAAVEAVMEGIPIITYSQNMASEVSCTLDCVHLKERADWVSWLAWQQWTCDEMSQGMAWEYIK